MIHNLNSSNFRLVNKKTLGINLKGSVLIYFKSQRCPNCSSFDSMFMALASRDQRILYGIVDVSDSNNHSIVQNSQSTTTPIRSVPHLLFYSNGMPIGKFVESRNIPSIQQFITRMLDHVQSMGVKIQNVPQSIPQTIPQNVQNVQQMQKRPTNMPQFETMPKVKSGKTEYKFRNEVDEDDDTQLLIPTTIIPHNQPWESNEYSSFNAEY